MIEKPKNGLSHPKNDLLKKISPRKNFFKQLFFLPNYIREGFKKKIIIFMEFSKRGRGGVRPFHKNYNFRKGKKSAS